MRRILLVSLLGIATVAVPASLATAKTAAKPATFKAGTYKAKSGVAPFAVTFAITLKRAKCTSAPNQGTAALHLCVSLPTSPIVKCSGATTEETTLGSFSTPIAVPTSGKVTEHTAVSAPAPLPGAEPEKGQSTFFVAFTKKGTATGYLEQSLTIVLQGQSIPCASGKVPFTAKLG